LCPLNARQRNSKALQLATGELTDLTSEDVSQLENVNQGLRGSQFTLAIQELLDRVGALDRTRDMVNVLWLDECLQVVLENLRKVVLELGATEVLEDLLPVWRVVIPSKVGLQLAREDFECGALANTVGSNKTEHLTRSWCRETVKLEGVGGVAMRDFGVQVGRKVDDGDGVERAPFGDRLGREEPKVQNSALLDTDTAADAKELGDECDLVGGLDFNTQLP
jgi:hypothetical protein